jgi:carboxylesterase type B
MFEIGFFSTRDSVIPGNMGLMDQIEAINWVKRYISYFGGDPNTITVGGQSAGSMSVSLLTMSPKSQSACFQVFSARRPFVSSNHCFINYNTKNRIFCQPINRLLSTYILAFL